MSQKIKFQKILFLVILNILGTITYAIGINCFAAPHNIAPGGASGIAILINYICGFPIGTFVFLFNVPLLIWIIMKKYFPKAFVLKTLATTALLSIVTDYLVVHIPVYQGDPLLASMFGGVLMGGRACLSSFRSIEYRWDFITRSYCSEVETKISRRRAYFIFKYSCSYGIRDYL